MVLYKVINLPVWEMKQKYFFQDTELLIHMDTASLNSMQNSIHIKKKKMILCTERDATLFSDAIVFVLWIGSLINVREDCLWFPL